MGRQTGEASISLSHSWLNSILYAGLACLDITPPRQGVRMCEREEMGVPEGRIGNTFQSRLQGLQ